MNKLLFVAVVVGIVGCNSSTTTIPEGLGETVEVPNDDGTVNRYVNMGNGTVFVEENVDLDKEARAAAEAKARLAAMSPKERYAIMVSMYETHAQGRTSGGKMGAIMESLPFEFADPNGEAVWWSANHPVYKGDPPIKDVTKAAAHCRKLLEQMDD